MEKIVSQLNSDGFYVGPAIADMSPLEPGVFLMPGGAVDIAPPESMENDKRYRVVDGRWSAEALPDPNLPFQPALPNDEQQERGARARRDALLARAAQHIAPLQDAVDLDIATEVERTSLMAWKNYRVLLNRVSGQTGFPATIDWPVEPA